MINHDEPTKFDLRKSYSIDESVAKMLGWMQGKIRVETVIQDKYGPIPRHLPHLYCLLYSLEEHLQLLLDRAKHEYNEALQDNVIAELYIEEMNPVDATSVRIASNYIVNEKYNEVTHWENVTEKALYYKSMIQEELEKKDLSELKIDQFETANTGKEHIKLSSLNEWAKQFGINIIETSNGSGVSTKQSKLQPPKAVSAIPKKYERADALNIVLDNLLQKNPELKPARVLYELGEIAKVDNKVIVSVFDEGVKWRRDNGDMDDIEITSKDALGERIRYWKRKNKQG
jgi:predicted transcriptional regulator